MSQKYILAMLVGSAAFAFGTPAFAEGPVSIYAGTGLFNQGDLTDEALQVEVAAGYDLGPKTIVPVRFRADVDYAFDSNTAGSSFNTFGVGISARLTTPTYFGAGVHVDSVTINPGCASPLVPYGGGNSCAMSTTGIGGTFFAGQRLVAVKDFALSIEASYKFLPNVGTTNVSAFGVGFRTNF